MKDQNKKLPSKSIKQLSTKINILTLKNLVRGDLNQQQKQNIFQLLTDSQMTQSFLEQNDDYINSQLKNNYKKAIQQKQRSNIFEKHNSFQLISISQDYMQQRNSLFQMIKNTQKMSQKLLLKKQQMDGLLVEYNQKQKEQMGRSIFDMLKNYEDQEQNSFQKLELLNRKKINKLLKNNNIDIQFKQNLNLEFINHSCVFVNERKLDEILYMSSKIRGVIKNNEKYHSSDQLGQFYLKLQQDDLNHIGVNQMVRFIFDLTSYNNRLLKKQLQEAQQKQHKYNLRRQKIIKLVKDQMIETNSNSLRILGQKQVKKKPKTNTFKLNLQSDLTSKEKHILSKFQEKEKQLQKLFQIKERLYHQKKNLHPIIKEQMRFIQLKKFNQILDQIHLHKQVSSKDVDYIIQRLEKDTFIAKDRTNIFKLKSLYSFLTKYLESKQKQQISNRQNVNINKMKKISLEQDNQKFIKIFHDVCHIERKQSKVEIMKNKLKYNKKINKTKSMINFKRK